MKRKIKETTIAAIILAIILVIICVPMALTIKVSSMDIVVITAYYFITMFLYSLVI